MALSRITVLISGRGSNLRALIDAARSGSIQGAITHVVSNRPDATGLTFAEEAGIATTVVDHRGFASRNLFDRALAAAVDAGEPDLVVLAGFMRVLDAAFVHRYDGRLINIHPSLLPAYPGLDTHRRVLADGVREHGCTVHYVTSEVDVGPIIAQRAVPVQDGDDESTLAARVLAAEHQLLPAAVAAHCAGKLVIENGRVRVTDMAAIGANRPAVPAVNP
jgi:phosphoribosylglycinamide formyltransferase-1